jgi:hypothetical protein
LGRSLSPTASRSPSDPDEWYPPRPVPWIGGDAGGYIAEDVDRAESMAARERYGCSVRMLGSWGTAGRGGDAGAYVTEDVDGAESMGGGRYGCSVRMLGSWGPAGRGCTLDPCCFLVSCELSEAECC